jgi:hypothetical protein
MIKNDDDSDASTDTDADTDTGTGTAVTAPSSACVARMSTNNWAFDSFRSFADDKPTIGVFRDASAGRSWSMVFKISFDATAMYAEDPLDSEDTIVDVIKRSALARIQTSNNNDFLVIRPGKCDVSRNNAFVEGLNYGGIMGLPTADDQDLLEDVYTAYFLFQFEPINDTGSRLRMRWYKKRRDGTYREFRVAADFEDGEAPPNFIDIPSWSPQVNFTYFNSQLPTTISNGFEGLDFEGTSLDNRILYARLFRDRVFSTPSAADLTCLFDDGGTGSYP